MKLLHLSDPHFGAHREHVAESLLRWTHAQRPDVVVLSGDITQRARRGQFDAARRFVDALGAPTLVIPGNHDIPLFNLAARCLAPYAGFVRAFGADLQPRLLRPDLMLACVNTTRAWRHKHGEIDAAQIEHVCAQLRAAAPGQLRVVVTHQPAAVPRQEERHNLLRGHARALAAWAAAGADLVLGGHIHLPGVIRYKSEAGHPLTVVLAGTAVSRRVRAQAGNSVNLIDWDPAARHGTVQHWAHVGPATAAATAPAASDWALRAQTDIAHGGRT